MIASESEVVDLPPDRGQIHLPQGYSVKCELEWVEIRRAGHKGDDDGGDLLFSSMNIVDRRPSMWICGQLNDEERRVVEKTILAGWGYEIRL
jgi:hypothetical protein